jgi:hypothetical protein
MFSNGKFKNIVADVDISKQIGPGETLHGSYSLLPVRGKLLIIKPSTKYSKKISSCHKLVSDKELHARIFSLKGATKNWIAVEGALFNTSSAHDTNLVALNSKLASSAPRGPQTSEEKNVFAIYVSYYVKVKLTLSSMGGEVTLKLPFVLGNVEYPNEHNDSTEHSTSNHVTQNEPDGDKCTNQQSSTGKLMIQKQSASVDSVTKPPLTRLDKLKTLKFHDNMTSAIDIITEELNNIHNNNTNKLVRSDSSRSNLNDTELYDNSTVNVIQAQVHHHHPPSNQHQQQKIYSASSENHHQNEHDNELPKSSNRNFNNSHVISETDIDDVANHQIENIDLKTNDGTQ